MKSLTSQAGPISEFGASPPLGGIAGRWRSPELEVLNPASKQKSLLDPRRISIPPSVCSPRERLEEFWSSMKEGKSAKQNQQQQQHQKDHLSPFKLAKLLDPEASWDKDQLGDVLHWIRQVVALVCGLLWGAIPLVGGIWIVLFLALSTGIVYGYYAMILKIDEEEYGGHGALLQEGLFASLTLFLLAWILVYSLAHF
ncbi:uncharacterized protein J3R85_008726 [Psidium guajava]|nr:uncharacterized protein J3R85_008726 [Psidium guajava]